MDWKFGDEAVPLKRDLDGGLRSGVMTYTKKKADRPGSIRSLCAEHAQADVNDGIHEDLILTCRDVSHTQALRDCFVLDDVPGGARWSRRRVARQHHPYDYLQPPPHMCGRLSDTARVIKLAMSQTCLVRVSLKDGVQSHEWSDIHVVTL